MSEGRRAYQTKREVVLAAQCKIYGPEHQIPEGFVLGPVPTDFGVGRSCHNPNVFNLQYRSPGMSLWNGDWVVYTGSGALRMTDKEFNEKYEEAL